MRTDPFSLSTTAAAPVRLFTPSREGFSLVELMVAAAILIIVFISWLKICNFQAVRKESMRRLAIEKASGYLDYMIEPADSSVGAYTVIFTNGAYRNQSVAAPEMVYPIFDHEQCSIGYHLEITSSITNHLAHRKWPSANWALIKLYDRHGVTTNEAGRPFSVMSVFVE
jgi:prepilin-type N-terminal cleavage/methylation domain-containing protein